MRELQEHASAWHGWPLRNPNAARILILLLGIIAASVFMASVQVARRDLSLDASLLYVERFSSIGVYIFFVLLYKNHLPSVETLIRIAAVLLALGTIGELLSAVWQPAASVTALSVLIRVTTGCSIGLIYLLFWHFFATFDPRLGVTGVLAAMMLREALYGTTALWGQDAIFLMEVWGRVGGFLMFALAVLLKDKHPHPGDHPMQYGYITSQRQQDEHPPLSFLWNNAELLFQVIVGFLLATVYGAISQLLSSPGARDGMHDLYSEGALVLLLALILIAFWSGRLKLEFNFFFVTVISLYAVAMLLLPSLWIQGSTMQATLLRCCMGVYEALLYAMLVRLAHDNPRSTYLYFAAFCAFANVSYGRLLGPMFLGQDPLTLDTLYGVCLTALFLMVVVCLVLFMLQRTRFAIHSPVVSSSEHAEPQASAKPTFAEKVDELCERNKLTAREREVLHETLHGYTMANAAAHLNISAGTVRTHLKSIYNKMGVSTKQELITLIDSYRS